MKKDEVEKNEEESGIEDAEYLRKSSESMNGQRHMFTNILTYVYPHTNKHILHTHTHTHTHYTIPDSAQVA